MKRPTAQQVTSRRMAALAVILGAAILLNVTIQQTKHMIAPADSKTATTVTTSRYVNWMSGEPTRDNTISAKIACQAAKRGASGVVVLGFGKQVDGGVTGFGVSGTIRNYDNITAVINGYAAGLTACGQDTWTIAVTTSNYDLNDSSRGTDQGNRWQTLVSQIEQTARVQIVGGIDMEPGWGDADAAAAWIDAYHTTGDTPLHVNASADGCPQNGIGGTCVNGWTVDTLATLVWGYPRTTVIPQIYRHDGAQSRQWKVLANTWLHRGGQPTFAAIMTQHRACKQTKDRHCDQLNMTAKTALQQMRNTLRNIATVNGATDIGWG